MAWERLALAHGALESDATLERVAQAFGFESFTPVKEPEEKPEERLHFNLQEGKKASQDIPDLSGTRPPVQFLTVHSRTTKVSPQLPAYLEDPHNRLEDEEGGSYFLPTPAPLLLFEKLTPLLFHGLGQERQTRRLDHKKLSAIVAKGKALDKIPYLCQQRWPEKLQIIVDTDRSLQPYWHDFSYLVSQLKRVLGADAVESIRFDGDRPGESKTVMPYLAEGYDQWQYHLPTADVSILLLSDFGYFSGDAARKRAWKRFAGYLCRHQAPVLSLNPAPDSLLSGELCRQVRPTPLDDRAPHRRYPATSGFSTKLPATSELDEQLTLLATLPVIFCSLLRPLREKMEWGSSSLEGLLWNHHELENIGIGKWVIEGRRKEYHKKYSKLAGDSAPFWEQCAESYSGTYRGLRQLQKVGRASLTDQETEEETKIYLQQLAGMIWQEHGDELLRQQGNTLLEVMPEIAFSSRFGSELHAIYGTVHREAIQKGELPEKLPAGLDLSLIRFSAGEQEPQANEEWLIVQCDPLGSFRLLKKKEESPAWRYPLATLTTPAKQPISITVTGGAQYQIAEDSEIILLPQVNGSEMREVVLRTLSTGREQHIALLERTSLPQITVESVVERIELSLQHRAKWKEALWYERAELQAASTADEERAPEFTWLSGTKDHHGKLLQRGLWSPGREQKSQTTSGLEPYQQDQYGIFQDIEIRGIKQRFRWCEPGRFLIGSPEDESKRLSRETQHEVTLTKGFWLGDTTVTQALWQAVMGENPSRFQGKERPVESVAWDDVQEFITRVNKELSGLGLRLPWEAEWEYACRAGTTTPFSFGENITSEEVNYNGNHPYKDGKKGLYRGETVEIKSLPCNAWGFYEMHGNVWEWCQDYFDYDLGSEPVVNPGGPERGDNRVVRGGSWDNGGGRVRSAFRHRGGPSFRDGLLGFRLAWGH